MDVESPPNNTYAKNTFKRDKPVALNVYSDELQPCCHNPKTGFYRDGFCKTGPTDFGSHIVCAVMTDEFLEFSKIRGNDLTQAVPECGFAGLKAGNHWCLCATRWLEAAEHGVAPQVVLESTHKKILELVDLELLESHAFKSQFSVCK